MPSLWKFGGLTPLRLITLAKEKLAEDELSTRAASLSYYFLLALFPLFLFLVSIIGIFAGTHSELQENIVSALGRKFSRTSARETPFVSGGRRCNGRSRSRRCFYRSRWCTISHPI